MITHVAVRSLEGRIWTLPPPNRHPNVFYKIIDNYETPGGPDDQGFWDDELGFLTRTQAAERARHIGQIEKLLWPPMLYSEDLW